MYIHIYIYLLEFIYWNLWNNKNSISFISFKKEEGKLAIID